MEIDNAIAPWRYRSGQMYLSDVGILESLREREDASPRDLSEDRRRENVIRLQCQYLHEIGLVICPAQDVFALSDRGNRYLKGSLSLPCKEGYFEWERLLEVSNWRIADFSSLDPVDIKITNNEFFESQTHDYGLVRRDRNLTERRIWNTKGWKLNRLMEEFPRTERLARQCAHWVRAIVGIHFFPDANHRTAMGTLYGLLQANDVAPPNDEWPPDGIDEAVLRSKLLRGLHCMTDFRILWLRDELYYHWYRFFTNALQDASTHAESSSKDYLRDVLEYARQQRRML